MPWRYEVGEHVTGQNCDGVPFAGTVTELRGPYSVVVDGVTTPVSLLHDAPPLSGGVFD